MDLKITIETNKNDLIEKILELVKGEPAIVNMEASENVHSKDLGQLLDQLTKKHPVTSIKNPEEWQRDVREDRALPFL